MTTISDKDRTEAQAMAETLAGCPLSPLGVKGVSRWLDVRDRAFASHTCQPAWRPTTSEEIQPGWEIRARHPNGNETTWGTAHHQDSGGNWRTEKGRLLTNDAAGWTYETTAPAPKPDPRIQVVLDWGGEPPGPDRHTDALDLLARLDNLKAVEYSEPHSN